MKKINILEWSAWSSQEWTNVPVHFCPVSLLLFAISSIVSTTVLFLFHLLICELLYKFCSDVFNAIIILDKIISVSGSKIYKLRIHISVWSIKKSVIKYHDSSVYNFHFMFWGFCHLWSSLLLVFSCMQLFY